jgi:short-subunit dehydrogenase
LDMYADVLRLEMRPLGVHVVTVVTGDVETTMSVQKMEPLPQCACLDLVEANNILLTIHCKLSVQAHRVDHQ